MGGNLKNKFKINLRNIKFRKLKTWQLCLILILLVALSATFLRIDHIKMTNLRDEVLAADEAEDDERLATALENLKNFTFNNIVINITEENGAEKIKFGTGPFYLEHQYLRAANKAIEEAESTITSNNNPNGDVYAKVVSECRNIAIQSGWGYRYPSKYINCVSSELQKYPSSNYIQDTITASIPSTELYRKEYSSPLLAPTFSGFLIVLSVIVLVIILIRAIIWLILRLALLFL